MKKILVLTDFSKKSEHAAEVALRIAEVAKAEVIFYNAFYVPEIVPATTTPYPFYEEYEDIKLENAKRLEDFANHVFHKVYPDPNNPSKPEISYLSEKGPIAKNVTALLKDKRNIWFIVMGDRSEKASIFNRINGDTVQIFDHATKPILLIPPKAKFKRLNCIALATTLDKNDYKALKALLEIAKPFYSKIMLIHVCPDRLTVEEKLKNIELLNKIKRKINYDDITYEDIAGHELSATLTKFAAAEKLDILSIIHKKHSFMDKLLHSSTSEEMMEYHKVPLMVFPAEFK